MIHDLLTKFKKPSVHAEGFLFLLLISLFSCATNRIQESQPQELQEILPQEVLWQPVQNTGFAEYFSFENKNYPLRYHCVKINLQSENLSIITYPQDKKDFYRPASNDKYFQGLTANQFSRKFSPDIAINAAPFETKKGLSKQFAMLLPARKIIGIHVAENKVLSSPVEKYSAVCFQKTESGYTGEILKNQNEKDFSKYDFAFGGFYQILTDSKTERFKQRSNDSRSAIGLSKDGNTLYLLAVEGENPSNSIGLSYQECAQIFLFLGASDAIQMDGGGSTTLFMNGKNVLSYPAKRKNAVFIGFKAKNILLSQ